MTFYDNEEGLPDPDDVEDGDVVQVGAMTFSMHKTEELNMDMLRDMLYGVKHNLEQAIEAFENVAETDLQRVNVCANLIEGMHEWSCNNRPLMAEWIVGAMGETLTEELEAHLREGGDKE